MKGRMLLAERSRMWYEYPNEGKNLVYSRNSKNDHVARTECSAYN